MINGARADTAGIEGVDAFLTVLLGPVTTVALGT